MSSISIGMVGISIMSSISIWASISISSIVSIGISVSISRPLGNHVGGSNGRDIAVGSVGVRVASNMAIGSIWVVGSSVGVASVASVGQGWGSDGLNLGNSGIFVSLGSLDNSVHSGQAIGETISSIGIGVSVTSIEDCGVSLGISLGGGIGSGKQTDNEELHLEQC